MRRTACITWCWVASCRTSRRCPSCRRRAGSSVSPLDAPSVDISDTSGSLTCTGWTGSCSQSTPCSRSLSDHHLLLCSALLISTDQAWLLSQASSRIFHKPFYKQSGTILIVVDIGIVKNPKCSFVFWIFITDKYKLLIVTCNLKLPGAVVLLSTIIDLDKWKK